MTSKRGCRHCCTAAALCSYVRNGNVWGIIAISSITPNVLPLVSSASAKGRGCHTKSGCCKWLKGLDGTWHSTDRGPQVRRDSRVQQRPALSQISKKENIYSERRAWLVFIPTPTSLTQTQNCNCSNQPQKRNLCFNKSLFPFSTPPLPIPSTFAWCLWWNHHLVTLKAVARHKCRGEFNIT